jgi:outer membrane lipoprotein-sorting protein
MKLLVYIISALGLAATAPMLAAEPRDIDANALVAAADAIRFPSDPFQVLVTVRDLDAKDASDVHVYQVLQKGHDNAVVRTLRPESESGQIMLLRGADLWVFMPDVSQPVRLPLSQRLTGQVANGDLARANLAGDYDAKLEAIEESEGEKIAVLELTAARKGVTYHRVRYWVSVDTKRPHKVEFYTLSGRLMKTGYYDQFEKLGNAIRPTRLVLRDALKSDEGSVLYYSDLKLRDLPDKFFTKDFLRKLQR